MCSLALLAALAPLVPTEPAPWTYGFAAGPHRAALEAAARSETRAPTPAAWPLSAGREWHPQEWDGPQWERWADAVEGAGKGSPSARAELVAAARAMGRHRDSWAHLAALPAEHAGSLLPHFLPGAPLPAGVAGVAGPYGPWPEGVTLRPAPPPPSERGGVLDRTSAEVRGFGIGASTLALAVTTEGDGIELRWTHLSGPAVSFQAVLPCPERLEITAEYLEWERQEPLGAPRTIQLEPGASVRMWGRYERRPPTWPGRLPEGTPSQWERFGFLLELPAEGVGGLAALPTALTRASGFSVRPAPFEPEGDGGEHGGVEHGGGAVRIRLGAPEGRGAKLGALVGLCERHRLRGADSNGDAPSRPGGGAKSGEGW